jgi:hypothetical protein
MFRYSHVPSDAGANTPGSLRDALPYLAVAGLAVGVLNFLWFMIETLPQNLIPSDRQVVDGHYFIWSKIHGGFVEVGRDTYGWLPLHEASVFLSWPLVMLAGGSLLFLYFSSRIAGTLPRAEAIGRAARVRLSGPAIASARTAGTIGVVFFSRPLLRVDVHPGGVLVKPPFLPERAILASEISAVEPGGGLSDQSKPEGGPVLAVGASEVSKTFRPRGPYLRIDHVGVGMATPLTLIGGRWDVAAAILQIVGSDRSATTSPATQPTIPSGSPLPRGIQTAFLILGVVVTAVLVWSGITFAIPQSGLPGVLWTVGLLAILAINVRRYLRDSRR